MPTQEERLTVLEQSFATFQRETGKAIHRFPARIITRKQTGSISRRVDEIAPGSPGN